MAPDGTKVILVSNIKSARTAADVYPDLPKANARIVDDIMYKHWDEWVTEIPHPFIADFDGYNVSNIKDIMQDEPYESPMKPFGGAESFAWTPDSKQVVYTSRKKTGKEYAISTNSDLYLYDLASGATRNLTEGMMGYDTYPRFSPDGSQLAWLSMEHDGYESDKNRIFVMDMKTGEKTDLTVDWDYTADAIEWNPDGKSINFLAPYLGVTPIFNINTADKHVTMVTSPNDICDYAALAPVDNNTIVTMRHSMLYPNEIFSVTNKKATALTNVNTDVLSQIEAPGLVKEMVPTTDGKRMTTWVVLPPTSILTRNIRQSSTARVALSRL
jgi:dipeptidyl aminopeptidase/acylaminoacyl peptidase